MVDHHYDFTLLWVYLFSNQSSSSSYLVSLFIINENISLSFLNMFKKCFLDCSLEFNQSFNVSSWSASFIQTCISLSSAGTFLQSCRHEFHIFLSLVETQRRQSLFSPFSRASHFQVLDSFALSCSDSSRPEKSMI